MSDHFDRFGSDEHRGQDQHYRGYDHHYDYGHHRHGHQLITALLIGGSMLVSVIKTRRLPKEIATAEAVIGG